MPRKIFQHTSAKCGNRDVFTCDHEPCSSVTQQGVAEGVGRLQLRYYGWHSDNWKFISVVDGKNGKTGVCVGL